jgi:hypothetical protein
MRYQKVQFFIVIIIAIIIAVFAAATIITSPVKTNKYQTEFPLTALEYTLSVNKEITLVLNLLETHMSNGRNVINGEYPVTDERDNVRHDIVMVKDAVNSVNVTYPAKQYADDREDILRRMVNAQSSLEAYEKCLTEGDMDGLGRIIDVMKSDFTALKGLFNNHWE